MPAAPDPVTGTPDQDFQPYDATIAGHDNPMGGWASVDANSGPAGKDGKATGPFPDGPGPWKQT
jgi:hypothetical protein